jgi:hypothetical protein
MTFIGYTPGCARLADSEDEAHDPAAFAGSPERLLEKFREVRDQIDKRIREWLRR